MGITIEEQNINISEHNLLCGIQGGLREEADGGSWVCVSRGGGIVSVALLVGVLNIETKAQKRKRLKFKFYDLHLLLSLGLSWSCCLSVRVGALVVCVCSVYTSAHGDVCAPADSAGVSADPEPSSELVPSRFTALSLAWH